MFGLCLQQHKSTNQTNRYYGCIEITEKDIESQHILPHLWVSENSKQWNLMIIPFFMI